MQSKTELWTTKKRSSPLYSDDGFIILSIKKKKRLFSHSYNQHNRRKKANQSKNLNLSITSKHDSKRQPSNKLQSLQLYFVKVGGSKPSGSVYKRTVRPFRFAAHLTCLGLSCVWLSPCPRRPYSPRPQVKSSPVDMTAALCELPQEIS